MQLTRLIPALAMSAALIVGCMAPQTSPVATTSPKGGVVGFFDQLNGRGAITIRLIDNRRSTQAFADAADFNAVRFELRNSSKLKAPRIKGVLAGGGTYGTVFTDLPSDTQERYTLTAGLFSGVTSPTNSEAPEYSNLDRKVGEGASVAFAIEPGESKTITLVINAVGDFSFDSGNTVINAATPTFVASDNTAEAQMELSTLTNPGVTNLWYSVVGTDGATASTATKLPSAWLAPPAMNSLPFVVPSVPGNYNLVVDMMAGANVLSRRSRQFTVEAPASVGSTFTDPTPTPAPTPTPTLPPIPTPPPIMPTPPIIIPTPPMFLPYVVAVSGTYPNLIVNGQAFTSSTDYVAILSGIYIVTYVNNSDVSVSIGHPNRTVTLPPAGADGFSAALTGSQTFTITGPQGEP